MSARRRCGHLLCPVPPPAPSCAPTCSALCTHLLRPVLPVCFCTCRLLKTERQADPAGPSRLRWLARLLLLLQLGFDLKMFNAFYIELFPFREQTAFSLGKKTKKAGHAALRLFSALPGWSASASPAGRSAWGRVHLSVIFRCWEQSLAHSRASGRASETRKS